MIKLQYASDLHLEFPENSAFLKTNPIKPMGDVLVLAGDIVLFTEMEKYSDFFSYLSDNFQTTYWIPGNHEYYHSDAFKRTGILHETIKSNVFLVNNTVAIHDDVKLVFSTLWSNISPSNQWQIESCLSDFHVIRFNGSRLSTARFNQLHNESLVFIKQELSKDPIFKTVVVSHHVPTFMNYPPKYKGDALNDAFGVELFDIIENLQPDVWIYGHSHSNVTNFNIGKTKLLTNQLGYVRDNEHFDFNLSAIITI